MKKCKIFNLCTGPTLFFWRKKINILTSSWDNEIGFFLFYKFFFEFQWPTCNFEGSFLFSDDRARWRLKICHFSHFFGVYFDFVLSLTHTMRSKEVWLSWARTSRKSSYRKFRFFAICDLNARGYLYVVVKFSVCCGKNCWKKHKIRKMLVRWTDRTFSASQKNC